MKNLILVVAVIAFATSVPSRADLCSKAPDPFYIRIAQTKPDTFKIQICPFNGESCYQVGSQYEYTLQELRERVGMDYDQAVAAGGILVAGYKIASVLGKGLEAAYTKVSGWYRTEQTVETVARAAPGVLRTIAPQLVAGGSVLGSSSWLMDFSLNPMTSIHKAGIVKKVVNGRDFRCQALIDGSVWGYANELSDALKFVPMQAQADARNTLRKGIELTVSGKSANGGAGAGTAR